MKSDKKKGIFSIFFSKDKKKKKEKERKRSIGDSPDTDIVGELDNLSLQNNNVVPARSTDIYSIKGRLPVKESQLGSQSAPDTSEHSTAVWLSKQISYEVRPSPQQMSASSQLFVAAQRSSFESFFLTSGDHFFQLTLLICTLLFDRAFQ